MFTVAGVRRLMIAFYFLLLVEDVGTTYSKYLPSPFSWAHDLFWLPLPGVKVRPFDLVMLGILLVAAARRTSKAPLVAPMRNALLLSAGTVVAWFVYGLARGGDARAGSWQIYLLLTTVLVAFTFAATFQTAEHYATLAKVLVAAAFYRALMCWIFYFAYVSPHRIDPLPDFVTTHDDSVLWVDAIIILIVNALEKRARGTTIRTILGILFVVGAIQWNQRRLAWVSLIMALVTMFFLLPPGKTRRRVSRIALFAAPVIALYVAIGWGRGERIFLPLRSLETVTTTEDLSTKARNVENLGLVATAHTGILGGTGWGHKYIELSSKYSIAAYFELWQYVPHNSILGLLAYTGVLGFIGYWLAFPTAVFFNSRMGKLGNTSAVRNAGILGAVQMIICANEMYGDMGLFSLKTMYILAGSYAVAMRLPITAGVWPPPRQRQPSGAAR
ncbi:MAG: hypothetical protein M3O36_20385 [Myxococcota bacterium]|nr:hypothetical protein [Myxococcota bacterium]